MWGLLDPTTCIDHVVAGGEDVARLMGVSHEQIRGTLVHLLWEDVDVDEAMSTAAALRASGALAEADGVLRAVADACAPLRANGLALATALLRLH